MLNIRRICRLKFLSDSYFSNEEGYQGTNTPISLLGYKRGVGNSDYIKNKRVNQLLSLWSQRQQPHYWIISGCDIFKFSDVITVCIKWQKQVLKRKSRIVKAFIQILVLRFFLNKIFWIKQLNITCWKNMEVCIYYICQRKHTKLVLKKQSPITCFIYSEDSSVSLMLPG